MSQVRGKNRHTGESFHALQEIRHLHVRVAIVCFLHVAPLAEQDLGIVEEEDGARSLRIVEHDIEILLGLSDLLADNA